MKVNNAILFLEIIDDLGDHIQRTDGRVQEQTQHVRLVSVKDRTCGRYFYYIIFNEYTNEFVIEFYIPILCTDCKI